MFSTRRPYADFPKYSWSPQKSLIEYYDVMKDPLTKYFAEKMQMLFRNEIVNNLLELEINQSIKLRTDFDLRLSMLTEDTLRNKKSTYISKKQNTISANDKKEINNIVSDFAEFNRELDGKIRKETLVQQERFLQEKAKRDKRSSSRKIASPKKKEEERGSSNGAKAVYPGNTYEFVMPVNLGGGNQKKLIPMPHSKNPN